MGRLSRQVQDRAREDFGDVTIEIAANWAQVILRMFSAEIARSASSYAGDVERGAAGTIRPMVLDGSKMMRSLDRLSLQPGTTDFLKGCLLAAIDEVDPFGNELVGQVATSCVLHAIAARRGRAAAQSALGSLTGRRIVLDTPILVALLGADASERRLDELIDRAVQLEMEVIVPEHVFDELEDVMERVTNEHLRGLASALKSGLDARAYAQIVNEQLLELFLDGVAAAKYKTWNDIQTRAKQLRSELVERGVKVRPHGNLNRSNVSWVEQTLTESIKASPSGRSAKAIARDAESVEMVWRSRRRAVDNTKRSGLWPGGWIVSYDRRTGPAYARVNKLDREQLVLTPAQWATLMAESAPATEIPQLVAAAASYVRQESMLRIATKYPPAIALTLARSLSGDYSSATDTRVAQLGTLGEALDHLASGESPTGERLVSELAARRSNRLAAAGKEQIDFAALERARLDEALVRNAAVVSHEHDARLGAEERVRELEAAAGLESRKIGTAVILTASIGLVIVFVMVQFWAFAVGTAMSAVVFAVLSKSWRKNPDADTGPLFLALIPEIIGVIDIGIRLGWFSG
jgi:rRNA-processing protein FCF1